MPCHRVVEYPPDKLVHEVTVPMTIPVAVEDYLLAKGIGAYKRETFVEPTTRTPMIRFRFEDETAAYRFHVATRP